MERRDFLKSAAAVGASAVFTVAPLAAEQGQPKLSPPGELYSLTADSKPQPGVPAGSQFSFTIADSRIYPGTRRIIDVYVPAQYTADTPACLWVSLDGFMPTLPTVFDNLIHRRDLPVMIAVGLHPGTTESAEGTQNQRFNRSFEFDSLTDVLARFILEELLPAVEKQRTPSGLPIRFSNDPNDRGIMGISSGGIGAFTVAWQRPNTFHRVYTMIGTYVGMRGGDRYPVLVRKTEPKPLRIFLQDNSKDGWPGGLELGDWWMSNQEMERALTFAGYQVNYAWQVGGHDSRPGESILPDVLRWLWKEWPSPVIEGQTSNFAIQAIAEPKEDWQTVAESTKVVPSFADNRRSYLLRYVRPPVIDEKSTAACLASDRQGRVYVQNPFDGVIYRITAARQLEFFAKVTPGDNGIAFGPDDRLYIAEARSGNILACDANGKTEIVAGDIFGHRLTVAPNGNIYVTQPIDTAYSGRVVLFRPGRIPVFVAEGLNAPAGISLTPDGLWLCVAEAQDHHAYSYRVQPSGELQYGEPFYWFHVPDSANDSGAMQICMDCQGWMYAATRMGVQVFDRNGRVTAILPVEGNQLAGICFGDADFQTLYVSTGSAVYRRKVKTTGTPGWQKSIVLPPWSAG